MSVVIITVINIVVDVFVSFHVTIVAIVIGTVMCNFSGIVIVHSLWLVMLFVTVTVNVTVMLLLMRVIGDVIVINTTTVIAIVLISLFASVYCYCFTAWCSK